MFKLIVLKKEQGSTNYFLQGSVINSTGEFKYSPEEEVIFTAYFRCYEEVFQKDIGKWLNEQKISLLLAKFDGLVWFVGFYGISTFVGYLTSNPFLCK